MYRILGYLVKYKYKKNAEHRQMALRIHEHRHALFFFFYKDVIPHCTVLTFYETTGTLSTTQKNGHK